MKGLSLYARTQDETEALVNRYAPLVKRMAYHLLARLPASVQVEDLIQAGMVGLLEATHRYDPAQGTRFATFAEWRIRGAMLDETRKGDRVPRSVHRRARDVAAAIQAVEQRTGGQAQDAEVAEQLGLSLAEYHRTLMELQGQKLLSLEALSADEETPGTELLVAPEPGPAEQVHQAHLLRRLRTAIDGLPERERLVVSLYYDAGLNLKEIGAVLRVSESRVSQLHSQALVRLQARVHD
jgi:RNA polymerase sigma factor for flagellar operon FliA